MRKNLAHNTEEIWKPPLFATNPKSFLSILRRFFDLQAGTIWRDMKCELRGIQGTLVDVGCGAQPYRTLLPSSVEYKGIDDARARKNFGYEIPNTTYFSGDAWPVPRSSFDTVLCTETLEHTINPENFLSEAYKCLKTNGRLILTVPFSARWHFIPFDYWRFTPSGLLHVLGKAGFQDIQIYGRGNAVTVACQKNMAIILRMLLPQNKLWILNILLFIMGLFLVPLFLVIAVIANISLAFGSGNDCLGYTVTARRIAP